MDCVRYLRVTNADAGEAEPGWELRGGNSTAVGAPPEAAVLNPTLCALVKSSGFDKIDILVGCELVDFY